MKLTQIRHATCLIEWNGLKFLVDPILYPKHTLEPIKCGIPIKNPLVEIPMDREILKQADYILLTHLHRDHFDPAIADFFGADFPIICHEGYCAELEKMGLRTLYPIKEGRKVGNTTITAVQGRHGTGLVEKLMGSSYGFVLTASDGSNLYITGDTVWCACVEKAVTQYKPKYIVAFAGAARIQNTHITMDAQDIAKLLEKAEAAKVVAVHMEAWNHCGLTRHALVAAVESERLIVPQDGEQVVFL